MELASSSKFHVYFSFNKRIIVVLLHSYPAEDFSIRAGSNNRIAGGVLRDVKRVIVNQEHKDFLNDLALLELTEPLVFNEKINKIDLLEVEIPTGEEVIISGWGLLKTNGDHLPISLQYNTVKALTTSQCKRKVLSWSDSLLCLSHPKGAGACNGDSGGPAAYNGKLAGVAGFVITGCGSSRPDGYAKVSSHLSWIKNNMSA